jgi:hypothetical protein
MEDRSPASGDTSGQELEPIEAEFVLPERISDKLVVPFTGELVHLGEPAEVARALESVRQAKYQLDDARRVLEDALRFASEQAGSRTLHLGGLTRSSRAARRSSTTSSSSLGAYVLSGCRRSG